MSKRIHKTARGLAALGRGQDKMLVHMTPHEVAGLQKLAVATGGTLTINPKTGLPEAGWLSSILPIIAGGAATILSGGTLGPVALAMLGAGSGAVGAKIDGEDPLMGALGGAMGGFGGGSLGNLAVNAGKAGAATAAAQTAASQAGASGTSQALGQGIIDNAISRGTTAGLTSGVNGITPAAAGAAGATSSTAGVAPAAISNAVPAGFTAPAGKEAAMAGIKGLATQPGRTAAMQAFKAMPQSQQLGAIGAGLTGVSALSDATASSGMSGSGAGKKPLYYHTTGDIDPITGRTTFGPGYWSKQYDYANRGMYDPNNEIEDAPTYKKTKQAYGRASGGLIGLAKGGRFLNGKGDGVSDSIPANIKTKKKKTQAAALSDGEFVIPARHVSELGNGSSKAGAQQLYAMLRRIEQRRKSTPYASDSGASAELPA